MSNLEHPAVVRVADALAAAGSNAQVLELAETARSAADAAASIGTELGSIVKSLVFAIGGQPVMALIAGDRQCDTKALPAALGLEGKAKRPDADVVREATGFAIGGVAPVAHTTPVPVVIDESLGRFTTVYAAAGHPYCVFATTMDEL
ncbi:MAG: YbaK/EbsC family protein, partial [Alphaproteobacteria bacterium]|nr:YbaK/EbsC family protein [Alphaproteobacteria bacterium]